MSESREPRCVAVYHEDGFYPLWMIGTRVLVSDRIASLCEPASQAVNDVLAQLNDGTKFPVLECDSKIIGQNHSPLLLCSFENHEFLRNAAEDLLLKHPSKPAIVKRGPWETGNERLWNERVRREVELARIAAVQAQVELVLNFADTASFAQTRKRNRSLDRCCSELAEKLK